MGVGGQRHAMTALPPGNTRYPFIGGWVGPRVGLDGCGKSRPHRDLIPGDRPACSKSLYRLRCPGPRTTLYNLLNKILFNFSLKIILLQKFQNKF